MSRPSVGKYALEELGIFELIVSTLRQVGSPIERLSISSNQGCMAAAALEACQYVIKCYSAEQHRPDKEALISSGLYAECLAMVQAYEQRGAEQPRLYREPSRPKDKRHLTGAC